MTNNTESDHSASKKKRSKWTYLLWGLLGFAMLRACAGLVSDERHASSGAGTGTGIMQKTGKPVGKIGEPYATRYFEVTVNHVQVQSALVTDNEFTNEMLRDKSAEEGSVYLVINATYRNIDAESRTISSGKLIINYQGRDITYDDSMSVPADGWGLTFETINPLNRYTTNIVYRIPTEIKGPARFVPHNRARSDEVIQLGEL